MKKARATYICQACGGVQLQWTGQCSHCQGWNTLEAEAPKSLPKSLERRQGAALNFAALDHDTAPPQRIASGISEFDRVCGGGLVPGSAILLGGDPGIGKSTFLLQLAAKLAQQAIPTYYISGEEAIDQIRMRATRLGVQGAPIQLASATNVADIIASVPKPPVNGLLIIDSIQTMFVDTVEAAPGTVTQVRTAAYDLIHFAKKHGLALILVGHVTKEGTLAGPRVLEHMVDAVFYFEGDRGHQYRLMRGVKNRFGPTDEIAVFEMTEQGLNQITNPSAVFLMDRQQGIPGSAVFCGIEGTRPLLMEIQALIAPTVFGTPQRSVVGWDSNRLSMILAVLEARCGLSFGMNDVYLSVAGGFRIQEPAADLAVAAALVSALRNKPFPTDAMFCGEIALSGEIRPITQIEARLKEGEKLGFHQAFCPAMPTKSKVSQIAPQPLNHVKQLLQYFATP